MIARHRRRSLNLLWQPTVNSALDRTAPHWIIVRNTNHDCGLLCIVRCEHDKGNTSDLNSQADQPDATRWNWQHRVCIAKEVVWTWIRSTTEIVLLGKCAMLLFLSLFCYLLRSFFSIHFYRLVIRLVFSAVFSGESLVMRNEIETIIMIKRFRLVKKLDFWGESR